MSFNRLRKISLASVAFSLLLSGPLGRAGTLTPEARYKLANSFAMTATVNLTAGASSVAEVLASVDAVGFIPPEETAKVREYFKERGLLDVGVKTAFKKDAIALGSSLLKQKDDGDLATSDGRLLGLNRTVPYSSLVIGAFERMTEKQNASLLNFWVRSAFAEETHLLKSDRSNSKLAEIAAAATRAGFYKIVSATSWLGSKIESVAQCLPRSNIDFNAATEMDEIRKTMFNVDAGRFVCDSSVKPYGVKRFRSDINDSAKRATDRAELAAKLNANKKNQTYFQCLISLNKTQGQEIAELSELYVEQETIEHLMPAYLMLVGPAPFQCNDETLRKLSNFELQRAELRRTLPALLNSIPFNDFLSPQCTMYKTARPPEGCSPLVSVYKYINSHRARGAIDKTAWPAKSTDEKDVQQ